MDRALHSDSCVYRTVEGHDLLADVHLPAGVGLPPVMLWLHGGGMIFGSRRHLLEWQLQRYLDEGFAVVATDYRLAPEVGLEAIVGDVVEAHRWVTGAGAGQFELDGTRIALVGHSAGAYLALMAACLVDPTPAAVVSFYGYGTLGEWARKPNHEYRNLFDLNEEAVTAAVGQQVTSDAAEWALDGRLGYYGLTRQQGTWLSAVCGDGRERDAVWLEKFEPIRHLTDRFPPTLLVHGDADIDVPVERSLEMADALAGLGVDHELIGHPEWGHIFDMNMSDPPSPPADRAVSEAVDTVIQFLHSSFSED